MLTVHFMHIYANADTLTSFEHSLLQLWNWQYDCMACVNAETFVRTGLAGCIYQSMCCSVLFTNNAASSQTDVSFNTWYATLVKEQAPSRFIGVQMIVAMGLHVTSTAPARCLLGMEQTVLNQVCSSLICSQAESCSTQLNLHDHGCSGFCLCANHWHQN